VRKGQASLALALGHRQNGTAKSLGQIRAKDKADGEHARQKWRDVNVSPALGFGQFVDADLTAVKNQQHQHQLWHATNQRGVDLGAVAGYARATELGTGTHQSKHAGNGQRRGRHPQSQAQAFKDGWQVTVEHAMAFL
jgi:hypothetical protein